MSMGRPATRPATDSGKADTLSHLCGDIVTILQQLSPLGGDDHLADAETHLLAAAVALKRAEQGIPREGTR